MKYSKEFYSALARIAARNPASADEDCDWLQVVRNEEDPVDMSTWFYHYPSAEPDDAPAELTPRGWKALREYNDALDKRTDTTAGEDRGRAA